MLKDLIKLANHFDLKGLRAEANELDSLIQKLAEEEGETPNKTRAGCGTEEVFYTDGPFYNNFYCNDTCIDNASERPGVRIELLLEPVKKDIEKKVKEKLYSLARPALNSAERAKERVQPGSDASRGWNFITPIRLDGALNEVKRWLEASKEVEEGGKLPEGFDAKSLLKIRESYQYLEEPDRELLWKWAQEDLLSSLGKELKGESPGLT